MSSYKQLYKENATYLRHRLLHHHHCNVICRAGSFAARLLHWYPPADQG